MNGKYSQFLLAVSISIFVFIGATLYTSTDSDFYYHEIEKGVIDSRFVDSETANEIASQVIIFFKGKGELSENLIGTQAKQHMKDVKNLRNTGKYIFYFSCVLIIISFVYLFVAKQKWRITKSIIHSSIIILCINILFFLASRFFFDLFWRNFHELIFTNELWQLSPYTDQLVAVFTGQFFVDIITK